MSNEEKIYQIYEEHAGIFHCEELEAIPYNHWKRDNTWLVLVLDRSYSVAFVPVKALTAREASMKAMAIYLQSKEEDYEDE